MSLLPRAFLINDAFATDLGDPVKPVHRPKPLELVRHDYSCAMDSDQDDFPEDYEVN